MEETTEREVVRVSAVDSVWSGAKVRQQGGLEVMARRKIPA